MKRYAHIHSNSDIISSRTTYDLDADYKKLNNTYWGIELDSIFSYHSGYSFMWTVATVPARGHHTGEFTPFLLQWNYTMRYVKLDVATRGWVYNDNYGYALGMILWYKSWSFIGVISI